MESTASSRPERTYFPSLRPLVQFAATPMSNMPVAGLPAALETLLSSLLAVQQPTSWKVDGEADSVVVVLRFKQRDGQPLPASNRREHYRKKTPAQRRRDDLRSRQHPQRGEQNRSDTLSKPNESTVDVAKNSRGVHDLAGNALSSEQADYVTESAVTFDPSSSDVHPQAKKTSSTDNPNAVVTPLHPDETVDVSGAKEATTEDLQSAISELSESYSRGLDKQLAEIRCVVAEILKHTGHDPPSPMPSAPDQCLSHREEPSEISASPPAKSTEDRTTQQRSAVPCVRQCVRDAVSVQKPDRRTPSTRQQPARAARKV